LRPLALLFLAACTAAAAPQKDPEAVHAALAARPGRAGLQRVMTTAAAAGSLADLAVRGSRTFTLERAGGSQRAVLTVRTSPTAPALPVLDEACLGPGAGASLAWWNASQDGMLLAYGVAQPETGDVELRLREVGSTMDLPDRISRVPQGPAAWLPDRTGFYYARRAAAKGSAPEASRCRIFFHTLGTDPARDGLVLSTGTSSDGIDLQVSADGGVLVLALRHPSGRGDILILDRTSPQAGFSRLPVEAGAARRMIMEGRNLFLLADPAVPPCQLLTFDLRQPSRPRQRRVTLQGSFVAQDIALLRDGLAVLVEENGVSRLQLHDRAGRSLREIPTPGAGGVSALAADPARDEVFFVWQSLFAPPVLCRYAQRSSSFSVLSSGPGPEAQDFRLRRARFSAADGTALTMVLASNSWLKRDGENPVILADLPRAGAAAAPAFSPLLIAWLGAGGLWAAPEPMPRNDAAPLLAAAAHWLAQQEYTRPGRIAVLGLGPEARTAAAAAALEPGLFAAAVLEQPSQDWTPPASFPPALILAGPCDSAPDPGPSRCRGLPLATTIAEGADILSFLMWHMGLEKAEPPPAAKQPSRGAAKKP
jgi:prolyl oligopeptidase